MEGKREECVNIGTSGECNLEPVRAPVVGGCEENPAGLARLEPN